MKELQVFITAFNRPDSLKRLILNMKDSLQSFPYKIHIKICLDAGADLRNATEVDAITWDKGNMEVMTSPLKLGMKGQFMNVLRMAELQEYSLFLEDDHFLSPAASAMIQYILDSEIEVAGYSLHHYESDPNSGFPFLPLSGQSDFYYAQRTTTRGFVIKAAEAKRFNEWVAQYNPIHFEKNIPQYLVDYTDNLGETLLAKYLIDTNSFFLFPYESAVTVFGDKGEHYRGSFDKFDAQSIIGLNKVAFKHSKPHIKYDPWLELHPESITQLVPALAAKNVEFDLNGNKTNYTKDWVVTCKKNKMPTSTFGLDLKPMEMNIICKNEGNFFTLGRSENIVKEGKLDKWRRKITLRWFYKMRYSVVELFTHILIRPFQNLLFDITKR